MKKVECIVCKKHLDEFDPQDNKFHPMDGLEFITYGHYGSTVFDPVVGREMLRVCICDVCVADGIENGSIVGDTEDASYHQMLQLLLNQM